MLPFGLHSQASQRQQSQQWPSIVNLHRVPLCSYTENRRVNRESKLPKALYPSRTAPSQNFEVFSELSWPRSLDVETQTHDSSAHDEKAVRGHHTSWSNLGFLRSDKTSLHPMFPCWCTETNEELMRDTAGHSWEAQNCRAVVRLPHQRWLDYHKKKKKIAHQPVKANFPFTWKMSPHT